MYRCKIALSTQYVHEFKASFFQAVIVAAYEKNHIICLLLKYPYYAILNISNFV